MRVFDLASGPKSNGAWCNRSPFDISTGAATMNIEVWNSITLLVRNLSSSPYIQLRVTIIRADRLLLQLFLRRFLLTTGVQPSHPSFMYVTILIRVTGAWACFLTTFHSSHTATSPSRCASGPLATPFALLAR